MKKKTIGGIATGAVCLLLAAGIFLLNGKSSLLPNEIETATEENQAPADGGRIKHTPVAETADSSVDPNTGRLTEAHLPVKDEDLNFIPWDFFEGVEFAVKNCELSDRLQYGIRFEDLNLKPGNRLLDHMDQNGTWRDERTWAYLRYVLRNPTSAPAEVNLPNLSIDTLEKDGKEFHWDGNFRYNPEHLDPPPGLTEDELLAWNGDLVTLQPGETREFFILYSLFTRNLDHADPAIVLNKGGGGVNDNSYYCFIRLLWD
jgi:hypothetical protein